MVKPFSVLANSQFSRFVAELSNEHNQDISQLLTAEEKSAFAKLWNDFCFGGYGDSTICSNLKVGTFVVYNKNDIVVAFNKQETLIENQYGDKYYKTVIVYKSKDGNIIFQQHDTNDSIVLVYVSENINSRLLHALMLVQASALGIKFKGYSEEGIKLGIPRETSNEIRIK